jgi:hypothetical protein
LVYNLRPCSIDLQRRKIRDVVFDRNNKWELDPCNDDDCAVSGADFAEFDICHAENALTSET